MGGLILIVLALVPLGAVIGLTMYFNSLLSRPHDDQPGMSSWLSVPLAFIGAVVVVGGVLWALLFALCSGMKFH